jgi:hypothetical protein
MNNPQPNLADDDREALNDALARILEGARERQSDDGAKGVQARMTGVLVAYARAAHEERLRGTNPPDLFEGTAALIAGILAIACGTCFPSDVVADAMRIASERARDLAVDEIGKPLWRL